MSEILSTYQLRKNYCGNSTDASVLCGVTLSLHRGQASILLGPSGSGKTTLLSILGCLLSPSAGTLTIDNRVVDFSDKRRLILYRRHYVGFVFQHSRLLPFLSIEDNLKIIGTNAGLRNPDLHARINNLLDRLGIEELRKKNPDSLSGGQRQRAAIARAVLLDPPLLIADEPTAALDWNNGRSAVRLLIEQAKLKNAAVMVVTHDTRLSPMFDRQFFIDAGKVYQR